MIDPPGDVLRVGPGTITLTATVTDRYGNGILVPKPFSNNAAETELADMQPESLSLALVTGTKRIELSQGDVVDYVQSRGHLHIPFELNHSWRVLSTNDKDPAPIIATLEVELSFHEAEEPCRGSYPVTIYPDLERPVDLHLQVTGAEQTPDGAYVCEAGRTYTVEVTAFNMCDEHIPGVSLEPPEGLDALPGGEFQLEVPPVVNSLTTSYDFRVNGLTRTLRVAVVAGDLHHWCIADEVVEVTNGVDLGYHLDLQAHDEHCNVRTVETRAPPAIKICDWDTGFPTADASEPLQLPAGRYRLRLDDEDSQLAQCNTHRVQLMVKCGVPTSMDVRDKPGVEQQLPKMYARQQSVQELRLPAGSVVFKDAHDSAYSGNDAVSWRYASEPAAPYAASLCRALDVEPGKELILAAVDLDRNESQPRFLVFYGDQQVLGHFALEAADMPYAETLAWLDLPDQVAADAAFRVRVAVTLTADVQEWMPDADIRLKVGNKPYGPHHEFRRLSELQFVVEFQVDVSKAAEYQLRAEFLPRRESQRRGQCRLEAKKALLVTVGPFDKLQLQSKKSPKAKFVASAVVTPKDLADQSRVYRLCAQDAHGNEQQLPAADIVVRSSSAEFASTLRLETRSDDGQFTFVADPDAIPGSQAVVSLQLNSHPGLSLDIKFDKFNSQAEELLRTVKDARTRLLDSLKATLLNGAGTPEVDEVDGFAFHGSDADMQAIQPLLEAARLRTEQDVSSSAEVDHLGLLMTKLQQQAKLASQTDHLQSAGNFRLCEGTVALVCEPGFAAVLQQGRLRAHQVSPTSLQLQDPYERFWCQQVWRNMGRLQELASKAQGFEGFSASRCALLDRHSKQMHRLDAAFAQQPPTHALLLLSLLGDEMIFKSRSTADRFVQQLIKLDSPPSLPCSIVIKDGGGQTVFLDPLARQAAQYPNDWLVESTELSLAHLGIVLAHAPPYNPNIMHQRLMNAESVLQRQMDDINEAVKALHQLNSRKRPHSDDDDSDHDDSSPAGEQARPKRRQGRSQQAHHGGEVNQPHSSLLPSSVFVYFIFFLVTNLFFIEPTLQAMSSETRLRARKRSASPVSPPPSRGKKR